MHVIAYRAQVARAAAVHNQSFVAPGEKMAAKLVPDVEAFGVNTEQPFHAADKICPRRFHDQMKMVTHQTESVNLPIGFRAGLRQGSQEQLTVGVTLKNVLPAVTSVDHVIDRARILNPKFARHGQDFALPPAGSTAKFKK